jgi:hypothetical protein
MAEEEEEAASLIKALLPKQEENGDPISNEGVGETP